MNKASLVKIVKKLSNGEIKDIYTSGTNTLIVHLKNDAKPDSVIKVAPKDDSIVDFGDKKLLREVKQIKFLKLKYPSFFEKRLPYILNIWQTEKYSAFEYLYQDGETVNQFLCNNNSLKECINIIENLIYISVEGYKLSYEKTKNNFFEKHILQRGISRLNFTKDNNQVFNQILQSKDLTINNKIYKNPFNLLSSFLDEKDQFEISSLSDCIHGDMHLDNVLTSNKDFVFLDVRGTEEKWDILYDLSRIPWSYGFCNHKDFKIIRKSENEYSIFMSNKSLSTKWNVLFTQIENVLDEINNASLILGKRWNKRFRLMMAVHYLAAAAPYLTSSDFQAAITCFLLGTIYLNRIQLKQNPEEFYTI